MKKNVKVIRPLDWGDYDDTPHCMNSTAFEISADETTGEGYLREVGRRDEGFDHTTKISAKAFPAMLAAFDAGWHHFNQWLYDNCEEMVLKKCVGYDD